MCYLGCEFENRSGGCKKPYDKKCPMEIDEYFEEEIIIRPCDTCENFYISPDGIREECNMQDKYNHKYYIKKRIECYENECQFYKKIEEV